MRQDLFKVFSYVFSSSELEHTVLALCIRVFITLNFVLVIQYVKQNEKLIEIFTSNYIIMSLFMDKQHTHYSALTA